MTCVKCAGARSHSRAWQRPSHSGKALQLLAWGWAGQGPGWGERPGSLGASEPGGGLAGRRPPQTRGVTEYEEKGLSCFLETSTAAKPHGPNSGLGTPLPPLLIPRQMCWFLQVQVHVCVYVMCGVGPFVSVQRGEVNGRGWLCAQMYEHEAVPICVNSHAG